MKVHTSKNTTIPTNLAKRVTYNYREKERNVKFESFFFISIYKEKKKK